MATDLDVLALRFPGAGRLVPGKKERFEKKVMDEWKGRREIPEIKLRTQLIGVV